MKLFEVAARRFSVRAVYDEDGLCQVMKKMVRVSREHQELAQQMAALLYEEVPDKGPPEDPWRFSSLYEGVIYQLKAVEFITKDDRLGLRIACFFGGSVKRCVNASGGGLLATRSYSIDVLHSCENFLQQRG